MDELLELERAGWVSLCNGAGSEHFGAVMTPDAVMVMANGQVMTRDDVVEALRGAALWKSYSMDDVRLIPLTHDSTAVVYTGTGNREEGEPFVGVMTSVYVSTDEGVKLALYQQTEKA